RDDVANGHRTEQRSDGTLASERAELVVQARGARAHTLHLGCDLLPECAFRPIMCRFVSNHHAFLTRDLSATFSHSCTPGAARFPTTSRTAVRQRANRPDSP